MLPVKTCRTGLEGTASPGKMFLCKSVLLHPVCVTRFLMPKINPSALVAIVACAIAGLVWLGVWGFGAASLAGFDPEPITPGERLSLIGFSSDQYSIRVANRVAHLVKGSTGDVDRASKVEGDNSNAKRLPIREMLGSLRGDLNDLSAFVSIVNDMDANYLPAIQVRWSEEDVQKALDGDPAMKKKLEDNLNLRLDGRPLDKINVSAIRSGIVIELKVPIVVQVGTERKTLTATVLQPYKSRFARDLESKLDEQFNPSNEFILGHYTRLADELEAGDREYEEVAKVLAERMSPARKATLAREPEQILQHVKVLVNDSMVTGGSSREYLDEKDEKQYDLTFSLTDEGRKRLWKYSRETEGFELLVVVDGIAIAAPRIGSELAQKHVTVTRLANKDLVDMAITAAEQS